MRYTVAVSGSMSLLNMAPVAGLDGQPVLEAIVCRLALRLSGCRVLLGGQAALTAKVYPPSQSLSYLLATFIPLPEHMLRSMAISWHPRRSRPASSM